jgi:hypothetical protein
MTIIKLDVISRIQLLQAALADIDDPISPALQVMRCPHQVVGMLDHAAQYQYPVQQTLQLSIKDFTREKGDI